MHDRLAAGTSSYSFVDHTNKRSLTHLLPSLPLGSPANREHPQRPDGSVAGLGRYLYRSKSGTFRFRYRSNHG